MPRYARAMKQRFLSYFWPGAQKFYQIQLVLFFGFALVAHLITAIMRHDMEWFDEHYQVLEPAGYLVLHRGALNLIWEWQQRYRSWVMPLLYVPVFFIVKCFGITGGVGLLTAARVFTTLLSMGACLRFHRLLSIFKVHPWLHIATVLYMACSAPMLLWSVTTLADNFVMMSFLALAPFTFVQTEKIARRGGRYWSLALLGCAWTMPALFKLQGVVLAIGPLLLLAVMRRKHLRQVLALGIGASVPLLMIGLVDALTYGEPFRSVILQVLQGAAISKQFGVEPWYDYYFKIKKSIGNGWLFVPIIQLLVFLVRPRLARAWFPRYRIALLAFGWSIFGYTAFHLNIGHKETRFLLPLFPLLIIWTSLAINMLPWPLLSAGRYIFSALGILAILSATAKMLRTPILLSEIDMVHLEERIWQERPQETCLLFYNVTFLAVHGYLILGDGITFLERAQGRVTSADMDACGYVIARRKEALPFAPFYDEIAVTQHDFVLLRKKS